MSEFLAEAQVRILPDTTIFRVELERQLSSMTLKPVTIPIVAAPVGQAFAAQGAAVQQVSQQMQVAATQVAATSTATVTAASTTKRLTDAQKLEARAARLLAISQEEVLNVTSELAVAQVTATRAASALAVARRANANLTAQDSAATVSAVKNTLALAEAQNSQAAAALRSAKATSEHAASMSFLSRGAGATGLSLLGIRGATLAANAQFLAGAAAVAAFAKSLSTAVSFNQQLSVFAATTGATADEMERVSDAARQLGRDLTLPGVTAGQAAEAMTELSRAGLSVNDSIAGARGVLQLATAAQLSNADATQLAASALNAFGLRGDQAVHVADLLANAANAAQGGIEDMGLALRQSAGVARQVGISLDDTVALLTLLARNGLQGSDAGTALRTSLIRLINPTKQAKDVLKELNVQLRDSQGNIRPEVFAEFANAQRNLAKSQQDANAAIVFGQDAIRALAILGREGEGGLNRIQIGLEKQGTAARLAAARQVGLTKSTSTLSNELDTLALNLGEAVTPAITTVVDAMTEWVSAINDVASAFGGLEKQLDQLPGSNAIQDFVSEAAVKTARGPFAAIDEIKKGITGVDKVKPDLHNAGAELRSAIEDAGREAARGAVSFGDQFVNAINAAMNKVRSAIIIARRNARNAAIKGVQGATGQAAGLEEQFNVILAAGGTPQQQIANLQRQAAAQARIIERAGPDAAGVLLEARRKAQAKLAQINQQIAGLQDQIVSDQKQAASDAQQKQNDADQALLDTFAPGQQRIDLASIRASSTETLRDDIAVQALIATTASKEIAIIERSVHDLKTRNAEVAKRVAIIAQAGAEMDRLRKQLSDQIRENALKARDAATDVLGKKLQLAQLVGNKDQILAAFDKAIADARARVRGAKKLGLVLLDEQIKLQGLVNDRKDFLKQLEEDMNSANGGLTISQFLSQNNELFQSIASNIGQAGVDPLSGFDFSKSIVATLNRFQSAARGQVSAAAAAAPTKPAIASPEIQRLIDALERNTAAVTGNTSTAGGAGLTHVARIAGLRGEAMARFWENRRARQVVEDSTSG